MSRVFDALLKSGDPLLKEEDKAVPKAETPTLLRANDPIDEVESVVPKAVLTENANNGYKHIHAQLTDNSRLAYYLQPHGLVSEQLRFLRRSLHQDMPNGGVLIVSSPAAADGKTLTAVNLAACLGDSGDTTLIADVDTRRPGLHSTIECETTQHGIEEAFAENVQPHDVVQYIEELKLHAAFVSAVPTDPSKLISGAGVGKFLTWARENFRWTVLDTPPVVPVGDVSKLLPLVDAVLLVIRAHQTPRDLTKRAFELMGSHLYGVIMNETESESTTRYSYFSRYYQGNGTNARIAE